MAKPTSSLSDHDLITMKPGQHPVVTCYLKLEPRDRARTKYLTKMKNRVKQLEYTLPSLPWSDRHADDIRSDLKRMVDWLSRTENLPASPGVALFASRGQGLFEVRPMPRVHRSRLAVDHTPLVRELAAIEEEFGKLITVVLDSSTALIWLVTAWEANMVRKVETEVTGGSRPRRGVSRSEWAAEHVYHNRILNEKRRHLESVARALFEVDRRSPGHQILVAGTATEAGAIEPFLHSYVRDRLIGTARMALKDATPAAVHQLSMEVREAHARASEHNHVEELEEALGGGWAVRGIESTLDALGKGQVGTLLVDAGTARPGFRSLVTGRLSLAKPELSNDGEVISTLDVVDDAIEEAMRQRVALDVMFDEQAAAALDGMAGLLRFK